MTSSTVRERIRSRGDQLTAAERRVAERVLEEPQTVGFGTVAELAQASDVGAATVVRLSSKLGFHGYSELQSAVQRELADQLRPAVERIRTVDDPFATHAATELANVEQTLNGVDRAQVTAVVDRLSDLSSPVAVISGDATAGVALQFVQQLVQVRPSVSMITGSPVAVGRDVALLPASASVVVIDLRRYERWVLDVHELVALRGIWSLAVTDHPLSPLASRADIAVAVDAAAHGPFDSHVGTLALLNLIAAAVAADLRQSATDRLEAVESAWRHLNGLDASKDR